nr:SDR family oxidoreductase [Chlamydia ibidis]
MFSLRAEDKPYVVVTGSTGELGSVISRHLYQKNYDLLLIGRQKSKLLNLHKNCPSCTTLCVDYSHPGYVTDYKSTIKAENRSISGLIIITPRPIWGGVLQSPESWEAILQTTFIAQTALIQATIPYMPPGSAIVIIGGTTSVQHQPTFGLSCVIRRMWTAYAKALSHELGAKGIRVNVVSPGIVLTPFHEKRIKERAQKHNTTYLQEYEKDSASIPLRRHCYPEEVAKTIEFFLSSSASFISGTNLLLDGGFTLSLY